MTLRSARLSALTPLLAALAIAGCGSSGSPSSSPSTTTSAAQPPKEHVQKVAVPKLVGKSFGAANHAVHRVGLNQNSPGFPGTQSSPLYTGNCKQVLTQAPPAGTKVPKGTTVEIVYGTCGKARPSPHFSGTG